MGMGIHCGPAVVGRIGYGETIHVTAIGDTATSPAGQDATRVSLPVGDLGRIAKQSGLNTAGLPRHELTVRNRREALAIYALDDVSQIAEQSPLVGGERLWNLVLAFEGVTQAQPQPNGKELLHHEVWWSLRSGLQSMKMVGIPRTCSPPDSSFPRTREMPLPLRELAWIPAFAGMTTGASSLPVSVSFRRYFRKRSVKSTRGFG